MNQTKVIGECRSSNGDLKWRQETTNLITTEGLIYALKTGFCFYDKSVHLTTLDTTPDTREVLRYCLFSSDSTPAESWTYSGIGTQFTEFTGYTCYGGLYYDETSDRPPVVPGFSSMEGVLHSTTKVIITSSGSIQGLCVVGGATKGDNSWTYGIMLNAARFQSLESVAVNDEFQIGIYVTCNIDET